jgi:hypothetical protein
MLLPDVIIDGDIRKRALSEGGGVLLGDIDRPLPNMFGIMMKYFWSMPSFKEGVGCYLFLSFSSWGESRVYKEYEY